MHAHDVFLLASVPKIVTEQWIKDCVAQETWLGENPRSENEGIFSPLYPDEDDYQLVDQGGHAGPP